MKRVYVAGPYTIGDTIENVKRVIDVADVLVHLGYAPYVPHLNHFWHFVKPHPYKTWMALSMEWLTACESLIRIEGPSPGADDEVRMALKLNIPVYYGLSAFLEARR